MKTIIVVIGLLLTIKAVAQEPVPCEVLPDSIKGTYVGECRSGKAYGEGKATGIHTYEGSFKNGYPEGHGVYTWPNGNRFTGNWKKGLKEGKGEYYIKKGDSTLTGFWKKNVYKGQYEKPFEVLSTSGRITRHDIRKLSEKGNTVTVNITSGLFGIANVDAFEVLFGNYMRFNKRDANEKVKSIEFTEVQFPFRLRFGGGTIIDFILNEPADWQVEIHL